MFGHPAFTAQNDCCKYGLKTCFNGKSYHVGIDYRNNGSHDIIACNFGKVVWIEYMHTRDHGMGNNVIIEHELINGESIYSLYAHLASIETNLYVGKIVTKGEKIGLMGGSGYGRIAYWIENGGGVHLHFEMKDSPVTHNPSGDGLYWGYTPNNPSNYGYHNANDYIGKVSVKPFNSTYIKFTNSPKVYYVSKDQLWWIKTEALFYAMGNPDFDDVIEYPADQYGEITKDFPVKRTVVAEYLIAKLDCNSRVYIFVNGQWRHFDNWDVFTSYGFSDNDILEIPTAVFNMYAEGETLKFVLSQKFKNKYFELSGFDNLGVPLNNPYQMPICHEIDGSNYKVYDRQDFEKGTVFTENGNIEIYYYNASSGIAEFKLINGQIQIVQYGIGGDAPNENTEITYISKSDSSQVLILRNIYYQRTYSWAAGGYVNLLTVVEAGTGHQIADVDNFLAEFGIPLEDIPLFRYRDKITNRKVNITDRMGMNARWREMQRYGWLIPSNLESPIVEYIHGDFGLRGYYEKGTLERVAKEQAEIAYRNYVAPIANEICQNLYNKNASSEQLDSLLAVRTTDRLKIKQVLMNVLPE
ncbi:M23 family metallopeptidase, partial [Patescibacteria group bacterium]